MNAAFRNAPLSPVSIGGSEWSVSKYPSPGDGAYPNNRGPLASPPISGGSSGTMSMNGFPSEPRSNGGPSPPPSIDRMSSGTNIYARRDSTRSIQPEMDDAVLQEHYRALRNFLNSRDPNLKQQPNKARDKLLRLSAVQFYELSTDVYDELVRRQSAARAPPNAPNGPPAFLLPEKSFHPKRNQARQRLSSLGHPRFRDLAADVFHELERRFPRFVGGDIPRGNSSMSMRGPVSRTGTPVNGNVFPPRGQSRMRRPSDASSIRGVPTPSYSIPPSPSLPPGEYGRPMPKQLNQSNMIVPNKSTMLEEDDDAFGLEKVATNGSKTGPAFGEVNNKLIEDYQSQVQSLREKVDGMEDTLKQRDDEMRTAMDDKQQFANLRRSLEDKVAEAQSLNDSMKQELDRVRQDHDDETRQLRDQVVELQQQDSRFGGGSSELQQENAELRQSLQEQRQVTEEVRREAQEFLREMRTLSQESESTYQKQVELEKTVDQLENEVRDWRNRYARTKTQLRNMRATSLGLIIESDASKYVRDKGFTEENGLVKDVHVTKFQIAIDELLQRARKENPETVMDAMKSVVVSVRRITKDVDQATPQDESLLQQKGKLKARVSAAANNLITASRNFAAAAGISPVSLLDAAASHLTAAVVDLLRTVKICATPAGELEDDDEGSMTPVDSTGFFSPSSTTQASISRDTGSLPPPPPFQGLGGMRASADSSAYSPVSSPRESVEPYSRRATNGATNGMNYMGVGKNGQPTTNGYGVRDNRAENLKLYLEDQTALLVSDIQNLVGSIRGDANIQHITNEIESIDAIIGKVISETQASGHGELGVRLHDCRERLLDASQQGQNIASYGFKAGDHEWRTWTQTLPPIAFEIARETKDIVQRVDRLVSSGAGDLS